MQLKYDLSFCVQLETPTSNQTIRQMHCVQLKTWHELGSDKYADDSQRCSVSTAPTFLFGTTGSHWEIRPMVSSFSIVCTWSATRRLCIWCAVISLVDINRMAYQLHQVQWYWPPLRWWLHHESTYVLPPVWPQNLAFPHDKTNCKVGECKVVKVMDWEEACYVHWSEVWVDINLHLR
jgi:hypothetical protein